MRGRWSRTWNRIPDRVKLASGAATAYFAVMALIGIFTGIHLIPMFFWGVAGAMLTWGFAFVAVVAGASWWFIRRRRRSVRRVLRAAGRRMAALADERQCLREQRFPTPDGGGTG